MMGEWGWTLILNLLTSGGIRRGRGHGLIRLRLSLCPYYVEWPRKVGPAGGIGLESDCPRRLALVCVTVKAPGTAKLRLPPSFSC
jgi:hypothetical protein